MYIDLDRSYGAKNRFIHETEVELKNLKCIKQFELDSKTQEIALYYL